MGRPVARGVLIREEHIETLKRLPNKTMDAVLGAAFRVAIGGIGALAVKEWRQARGVPRRHAVRRLSWRHPSHDPADLPGDDPAYVPSLTARRTNAANRIMCIGNGQYPPTAYIMAYWGFGLLDALCQSDINEKKR